MKLRVSNQAISLSLGSICNLAVVVFVILVVPATYPGDRLYSVDLKITKVAEGFQQPTEIVFLPGSNTDMIVLEKSGKGILVDL